MSANEPHPDPKVSTYSRQYRRCGKPACASCASGPGHGPYWYAYWWEQGTRRTRYLGRVLPVGATAGESADPPTVSGPPGHLRVRTLGGFAVWCDGRPVGTEGWGGRGQGILFKWLLCSPGGRLEREAAADLLWPGVDFAVTAARLRGTVRQLRQVLAGPGGDRASPLRSVGSALLLDAGQEGGWLDAATFERAAGLALAGWDPDRCRAALALWGGDYLPEDGERPWTALWRTRVAAARRGLLQHLASLYAARGTFAEAEVLLKAILAEQPTYEGAAGTLMALLSEGGRHAEAAAEYGRLAAALAAGGTTPCAVTLAIHREIRRRRAAPLAVATWEPGWMPVLVGNLPAPSSPLIGRVAELAHIERLLLHRPMDTPPAPVTLVGAGGVGKTRLALEAARRTAHAYPAGVWLLDLANMDDPELLGHPTLGEALQALLGRRLDDLGGGRMLLLLDTCEHWVASCAALVRALALAAGVRILATSRRPLGLLGEETVEVASLPYPEVGELSAAAGYPAIEYFAARAGDRVPGFAVDGRNLASLTRICAALDGLPLAMDLAASHLGVLTPDELAARLTDPDKPLGRGGHSVPERHRTMHANLVWSVRLAGEGGRDVLARLVAAPAGLTTRELRDGSSRCAPMVRPVEAALARLQALWLVRERADGYGPDGDATFVVADAVRRGWRGPHTYRS